MSSTMATSLSKMPGVAAFPPGLFLGGELPVLSVSPPLIAPPCIWTFAKMKEFKSKLGKEKNSRLVVKRGEVVTIRVPTHPEGKRVCWEFATDDYDIGFGVYFDWTPVTSTDITVQVSDSSEDEDEDEEEEEEIEGKFNFNIICSFLFCLNLICSDHFLCCTSRPLPGNAGEESLSAWQAKLSDAGQSQTLKEHSGGVALMP